MTNFFIKAFPLVEVNYLAIKSATFSHHHVLGHMLKNRERFICLSEFTLNLFNWTLYKSPERLTGGHSTGQVETTILNGMVTQG